MEKLLVFIVLAITLCSNAQEVPENFKFSSMITLNEFPIGNATGVPDISIPLYSCKTAGDLNVDLNLQYNLQGSINSNILGSQFGDAWNLTMGGIISRDVKGRHQPFVLPPYYSTGYYDFDENYYNRNTSASGRSTSSDLYAFDVMGLRGKFIIKKSGSSFIAEVIESNDYLKINVFKSSSSILIDKIEIQDKKGMVYTFTFQSDICPNIYMDKKMIIRNQPGAPQPGDVAIGHTLSPEFDNNVLEGENNYSAALRHGPSFWKNLMLTKVTDRNGKLLLEMTYDQPIINIPDPSTAWINGISNFSSVAKPYLKEIKITNIGSINFNNAVSSSNIRNFTDSYIYSIQIKDLKGALIKEFQFQYEPLNFTYRKIVSNTSGSYTNYYFKKIFLNLIREYNSSKTQSNNTIISYNTTFGNEINDQGYCQNSATKATSTAGAIQRIKYPTGGSVQYQFETHDYLAHYDNSTLNGRGLRLKRTAHFVNDQVGNYLYVNPTVTNAEQLITYEYKDHTDISKSSGRVKDEILYLTGNPTDEQNALLYQKVKVSKTGIGYKEFFFKNVPNNNSLNNSNFNFYRRQLEESKTFDANGILLDKNIYNYQYSFLSDEFNIDSYSIDPYIVSEDRTISLYEGSQSYGQTQSITYNSSNRQISSSNSTDNQGVSNKTDFYYNIINNAIVNTQIRNYIDNNLTEQLLNTYGTTGDFVKKEFKTSEMSAYEKVGNDNNKHIGGLVRGYIQPDGTPVTLIYGYLDTQIIAKLVNVDANLYYDSASYQTIRTNLDVYSTQWHANYSEANLKNTLNGLRTTFPNALVTTYTYKPMVGVSSVTDENGKTTTYEYDTFNRLATVKDYLGNILKEYKYNFSN